MENQRRIKHGTRDGIQFPVNAGTHAAARCTPYTPGKPVALSSSAALVTTSVAENLDAISIQLCKSQGIGSTTFLTVAQGPNSHNMRPNMKADV